mmetsp:Transcript_43594/g.110358  ORF Transcript_43594/g.110358 Transcript_43594/m.110358 type:complete len:311 (+) Transcript_43594:279-1211(+)
MRVPNWMARLTRSAARGRPRLRSASRSSSLSPTPRSYVKLATTCSGMVSISAMKSSSRKGCRASRPQSAMSRSSRPRLRSHRRFMSSASSSCRPCQPEERKRVWWRPYPAHCSSAPWPSSRIRAAHLHTPASASCPQGPASRSAPSPRAASHSAAPMLRSITVPAGCSRSSRRCLQVSTSASVLSTRNSLHRRAGAMAESSSSASSAASRSGDWPSSKQMLMRSMGLSSGTDSCASAASSVESTPPLNRSATRPGGSAAGRTGRLPGSVGAGGVGACGRWAALPQRRCTARRRADSTAAVATCSTSGWIQ